MIPACAQAAHQPENEAPSAKDSAKPGFPPAFPKPGLPDKWGYPNPVMPPGSADALHPAPHRSKHSRNCLAFRLPAFSKPVPSAREDRKAWLRNSLRKSPNCPGITRSGFLALSKTCSSLREIKTPDPHCPVQDGLPHATFTEEAVNLIARSSEGTLRAVRNLCVGALIEAVRDQTKTVGLKQVNAVLLQPHWRHNQTADPSEPVLIRPNNLPPKS